MHGVWLAGTLTIERGGSRVIVAHSTDGQHWSLPVAPATGPTLDKDWLTCDNGAASPFRGRCYARYTDDAEGRDGQPVDRRRRGDVVAAGPGRGHPRRHAAGGAADGTLVFIAGDFNGEDGLARIDRQAPAPPTAARRSRASSSRRSTRRRSTPMRAISLPSLALDGSGTLYATWGDCRFRAVCAANDLVLSTSTDGVDLDAADAHPRRARLLDAQTR